MTFTRKNEKPAPGSALSLWKVYRILPVLATVLVFTCFSQESIGISTPPNPTFPVSISFWTDCYPNQTSWELSDQDGEVVESDAYSGYAFPNGTGPHEYDLSLEDGCYTFTITDSGNNGMNSGGSFFCWYNGDFSISSGEVVLAELDDPAFGNSVSYNFCLVAGCTDPVASNYNEDATLEDGSCEYPLPEANFDYEIVESGCGQATVNFVSTSLYALEFSWSSNAGSPTTGEEAVFNSTFSTGETHEVTLEVTNPSGSSQLSQMINIPSDESGTVLDFVFEPDCWANEIGWVLYNPDGDVVAQVSAGDYENEFPENTTVHRTPLCASNGCYTLELTDEYGDGMAGEMYTDCNEDGIFYIEDNEGNQLYLFDGDANFGDATSEDMCLQLAFTWTGVMSSDWNNPANWAENQVPGQNKTLIFDQINYTPDVAANIEARDFIVNAGSSVDLNQMEIDVTGDIVINGNLTCQGATINLLGAGKHFIKSNAQPKLHNLNVNVDTAEVSAPLSFSGQLRVEQGVMDMNDNLITLLSDADKTGSIGRLTDGAELLADEILVQRYFPAGPAGWRMICTPIQNATFEQWNDDFVTTGFEGSDYPYYGGAETPWSNIRYYDETVIGPGTDVDDGLVGIDSVTDSIDFKKGYFVYMVPSPTMVEVQGSFNRGETEIPLTYTPSETGFENDGWNLVSNPYPSAISWDAISGWLKDEVFDAIYLYNPETGQYSSYVGGISNGEATAEIASGQSFWVKCGGENPQMIINEYAKVSSEGVFMKNENSETETVIHIELIADNNRDKTVIGFNSLATNNFDGNFDAYKIAPQNEELPSLSSYTLDDEREDLAINLIASQDTATVVDLKITPGVHSSFLLTNSMVDAYDENFCLILEDRETGEMYSFNEGDEVPFAIGNYPIDERFALHLSAPLNVQTTAESCPGANDGVALADGYGEAPWSYEWTDLDGNEIFITAESDSASVLDNLTPGFYQLQVSNQSSVCATATTTFEIEQAPEPAIELAEQVANCNEPQSGSISLDIGEDYVWEITLQNQEGESLIHYEEVGEDFVIDSLDAGVYRVLAGNSCDEFFETHQLSLRDDNAPVAQFTAENDTVSLLDGGLVSLNNLSINADSYLWEFGDGQVDSLSTHPAHIYSDAGDYSVKLRAANETCEDEISRSICVVDHILTANDNVSDLAEQDFYVDYASGIVSISAEVAVDRKVLVEVVNSAGQRIYSESVPALGSSPTNLAVGQLAQGMFWVNLISGNKRIHTQKILETHQ